MTSGKALVFHCHFAGFIGTDTSFPGISSSFSSCSIGMMRMEWKYNDKSTKKMTINEKGNMSIDEIIVVVL